MWISAKRERHWERQQMLWSQERRELLDRIMYLSGHPWGEPPQDEPDETYPPPDYEDPLYTALPSDDFFDMSEPPPEAGRV